MSRPLTSEELTKVQRRLRNDELHLKKPTFNEVDVAWLRKMVHEGQHEFCRQDGKMFDLSYGNNATGDRIVRWKPVEGLTPIGGIEITLLKSVETI